MNTQFTNRIRGFAFLSALFLMLVSVAPSAMAREGVKSAPSTTQSIAADESEPGCD